MPLFEYKAINDAGKTITGTMEAPAANAVSEHLSGQNYIPLKIAEKKQSGLNLNINLFGGGGGKPVKVEEVINFTKYLVTLLRAGVPIISALNSLRDQADNETMKEVLQAIADDVESGNSFSAALRKHPKAFDGLYVNTVQAGETGGVLDQVLTRLASLMAYEKDIQSRVKGAVRYPIIVICGIFVAFSVLMIMVVPTFVGMFENSGVALPLPTQILIGTSTFLQVWWPYILVALVAAIFAFFRWVATPKGEYTFDKMKLKFPVFGDLFLKTAMSRFAHMFEALNKSGLPILQTMDIVSSTIGNAYIGTELKKVGQSIEKGKGISRPLEDSKLFPPLVIRMIAVGEQSGSLDDMLKNVAEHYDTEVNYLVENLVTMIEPILTITIGSLVMLLALGIFMPMWDMISAVQGQ